MPQLFAFFGKKKMPKIFEKKFSIFKKIPGGGYFFKTGNLRVS
jgi:hypothetical protein